MTRASLVRRERRDESRVCRSAILGDTASRRAQTACFSSYDPKAVARGCDRFHRRYRRRAVCHRRRSRGPNRCAVAIDGRVGLHRQRHSSGERNNGHQWALSPHGPGRALSCAGLRPHRRICNAVCGRRRVVRRIARNGPGLIAERHHRFHSAARRDGHRFRPQQRRSASGIHRRRLQPFRNSTRLHSDERHRRVRVDPAARKLQARLL